MHDAQPTRGRANEGLDLTEALSASSVPPLVLVADDDAAVRDFVCDVLAQAGFRTVTAADGDKSPSRPAHQPGLIILDVKMPKWTDTRHSRASAATHHPGHPGHRPHRAGRARLPEAEWRLGAVAHLTKPFSPQLTQTVRRVLPIC